jgi:glycine cleavage system regulatory protein
MVTCLVLTVIGRDRPGLVDALSGVVAEHGGNWEEARMSHLADQFAGILRVRVPERSAGALVEGLRALDAEGLLHVTAERGEEVEGGTAQRRIALEITGQDHPGIIRDLSHAVAGLGIGIEELHSETRSASMSGETLFHASIQLSLPAKVGVERLREALESLANEIMVDIDIEPGG